VKRLRRQGLVSDITVTPLVDVVLVLLIIFLVVAPELARGAEVSLPIARRTTRSEESAVVLTVHADGTVQLGASPLGRGSVAPAVRAALATREDADVVLRGDAEASYGDVMGVFEELRGAGIASVGLAADPPQAR
jgi:biopolymer transport protein TolR